MTDIHSERILILDFGSQYTQLIARRIRECNVHSIILPYDYKIKDIDKYNVKGFILSGGPSSVYEKSAPYLPKNIFEYNGKISWTVCPICSSKIPLQKDFKNYPEFQKHNYNRNSSSIKNRLRLWLIDHPDLNPYNFFINSNNTIFCGLQSRN